MSSQNSNEKAVSSFKKQDVINFVKCCWMGKQNWIAFWIYQDCWNAQIATNYLFILTCKIAKRSHIQVCIRIKTLSLCLTSGILYFVNHLGASLVAQMAKHVSAVRNTRVRSLGWEDPLEKEMAAHSSSLAWRIPWTEEPGGLQSMGSLGVGHDWATSLSGIFMTNFYYQGFLP